MQPWSLRVLWCADGLNSSPIRQHCAALSNWDVETFLSLLEEIYLYISNIQKTALPDEMLDALVSSAFLKSSIHPKVCQERWNSLHRDNVRVSATPERPARIWDMEKTESLKKDKGMDFLYPITSVLVKRDIQHVSLDCRIVAMEGNTDSSSVTHRRHMHPEAGIRERKRKEKKGQTKSKTC